MNFRFLSSGKKGSPGKDLSEANDYAEFVPYACHFNPHTLLTKNGELLQICRIARNSHHLPNENDDAHLRDSLRAALLLHAESEAFSFWFHTLREREKIELRRSFPLPFADELERQWQESHGWNYLYHNEVYISILHQGQAAELFDMKDFQHGFSPQKNRAFREHYLESAALDLDSFTERLRGAMSQDFIVERLAIRKEEAPEGESFYSEPLEFLSRLIRLAPQPFPLADADASDRMMTHALTFGFNALESRLSAKNRRFAAMLSLKCYHELPLHKIDQFIQQPMEMVISQSFDFISAREALEKPKEIQALLVPSRDEYIANITGISAALQADHGRISDFGRQQTSIMLVADEWQELEDNVARLQEVIGNTGLVAIREDIQLQECFWAQLPGNFEFLRRQQKLPTMRAAGMTRLNFYPTGETQGAWGGPITIFPTLVGTPYLFHFHHQANGHSVLLDFNSFPDTQGASLLHFLLAQASQAATRMVLFDQGGGASLLAERMGAGYVEAGGMRNGVAINPFAMENDRRNKGFLLAWLGSLLMPEADHEEARQQLRAAVEASFAEPVEMRGAARFVQLLADQMPALAEQLRQRLSRGSLGVMLSSGQDSLSFPEGLTVIDMLPAIQDKENISAIFSYFLHRLILSLDGRPTLIALREAWDLLDHPFFASRLESLFEMLREHNAILLLTGSKMDRLEDSPITADILRLAATRIFVPDDVDADYLPELTGLSPENERLLLRMERQKGEFLICHGEEVIPCVFHVKHDYQRAVLGNDRRSIAAMTRI